MNVWQVLGNLPQLKKNLIEYKRSGKNEKNHKKNYNKRFK